jgi:hypothetical protein
VPLSQTQLRDPQCGDHGGGLSRSAIAEFIWATRLRRPGCRERSRHSNVRRLRPPGFHPMSQRMRRAPAARRLFCPWPSRLSRCSLRQRRPRKRNGRRAPPRFAPIKRDGVTLAARRDAPKGVGTRTSRKIRPRLRRGSNKEQCRASQQESSKQGTTQAVRRAQEPTPQRSLNPAPRPPRHFANPTPAGVPVLAPSRFANPSPGVPMRDLANPSPATSAAGRRPFCIFDAGSIRPFASSWRAPRAQHGILPRIWLPRKQRSNRLRS